MVRATQTIHPLHFEDLEPHRFEDLVRQLSYSFRPWLYIEATGRLGQDEGVDIRGVERVTVPAQLAYESSSEETENLGEEQVEETSFEEREWRIQCKRYKRVSPQIVRAVVSEAIPASSQAPYGLILAAACDMTTKTMAAFREEAYKRGVIECHLWTKAQLEDLLFRPENDHLLFAYFGLSLTVKRRGQLQQIRALMTLKRKLLRAFELTAIKDCRNKAVLIRDVNDQHDLYPEGRPEDAAMLYPPWHVGLVKAIHVKGLLMSSHAYHGWMQPDGRWDLLEASAEAPRLQSPLLRSQAQPQEQERRQKLLRLYKETVPQNEQVRIEKIHMLPFTNIVEVDPLGDLFYVEPHLYCQFGVTGPYLEEVKFLRTHAYDNDTLLDPNQRSKLFRDDFLELSLTDQG